tara:strand:- start:720 stop:1322 length:603 start_codon:yes stop_codon:yes gene_type:complete
MSEYNQNEMNHSSISEYSGGKAWLETNWPKMRVADVNWTMERGNFPSNTREYIFNSGDWIKVNDENGGTYCEKLYYEQTYKNGLSQAKIQQLAECQIEQLIDTKIVKEKLEAKKLEIDKLAAIEAKFNAKKNTAQKFQQYFNNKKNRECKCCIKNNMDKRNQNALNVLQNEGTKAAIKHMFTDDKSGRQLSYSEMRSRYG